MILAASQHPSSSYHCLVTWCPFCSSNETSSFLPKAFVPALPSAWDVLRVAGFFLCPTSGRKNVTFHDCSPQSALTSLNYYWSYHRTWCFGCLCRYLLLYIRSLFVYLSLLVCKLIQGRDPIIHTISPCLVWTLAQGKHPINIYE